MPPLDSPPRIDVMAGTGRPKSHPSVSPLTDRGDVAGGRKPSSPCLGPIASGQDGRAPVIPLKNAPLELCPDACAVSLPLPASRSRLPSLSCLPSLSRLLRDRLPLHAAVLLGLELGFFVFLVAGAHGAIVPLDRPSSTDFLSFYAAGVLAHAGTPWLAYDRTAHHAAEQALAGAGVAYNYFYYPPIFLAICAQIARLPYLPAYVLFQAATGIACFFAARAIRRDLPWYVFLAFPAFWWTIGTGQNALATAALFAAGTAAIDRRPWLAGVCFGALCYKPHLGLLIPVALIAGGHWRAIAAAAVTVLTLTAGSVALFGAAAWQAFFSAAAAPAKVYAAQAIFMGGLTSPYGVAMTLGLNREASIALQCVVIGLTGWIVARVWCAGAPLPARAAILLAATPVAVPVAMFYDLMLVFVALLWLSRLRPAPSWLWPAMAAVFVLPLFSGNLSTDTPMFLAAISAAACFATVLAAVAGPVWSGRLVSSPA